MCGCVLDFHSTFIHDLSILSVSHQTDIFLFSTNLSLFSEWSPLVLLRLFSLLYNFWSNQCCLLTIRFISEPSWSLLRCIFGNIDYKHNDKTFQCRNSCSHKPIHQQNLNKYFIITPICIFAMSWTLQVIRPVSEAAAYFHWHRIVCGCFNQAFFLCNSGVSQTFSSSSALGLWWMVNVNKSGTWK